MNVEYSEVELPPEPELHSVAIAVDTGSPLVSVAISVGGDVVGEKSLDLRESSSHLLRLIDELLEKSEGSLSSVSELVGLRGPGSFTGLRIGMATLLGLGQAGGIRVGTVSTLDVLATLAPTDGKPIVACADALRDQWLIQKYEGKWPLQPRGDPLLLAYQEIFRLPPSHLVGFGISRLQAAAMPATGFTFIEPGPLARQALEAFPESEIDWGMRGLTFPIYQRPPAVSLPKKT